MNPIIKRDPKKKILKYNLIFDTEVLGYGPICDDLKELNKQYSGSKDCKLTYFIPEVVKLEYEKRYLEWAQKRKSRYYGSIDDLNKMLRKKIKKRAIKDRLIKKAVENELDKYNFKILALPKNLDPKVLMEDAVWKPLGEKVGFRDSLTFYTVEAEVAKLTKDAVAVFICGDKPLGNAVGEKFKKIKKLLIYETIPDFKSKLRLDLEKLNDEFISIITENAETSFKELFKEKILDKIRSQFSDLFIHLQPEVPDYTSGYLGGKEKWEPASDGLFYVTKPEFEKRLGEESYIWQSIVVYNQEFKKIPSIAFVGTADYGEIWRYTLEFCVRWSAKVDEEGSFSELKLEGEIELKNKHFRSSYMAGYVTKHPEPAISTASGTALELLSSTPSISDQYTPSGYLGEKQCRGCGKFFIPSGLRSLVDENLCDECWQKRPGW